MAYQRRGGSSGGGGDAGAAADSSPGKRSATQRFVQRKPAERQTDASRAVDELASGFGDFPDATVRADAEGDARARAHGSLAVTEGSEIFVSNAVEPTTPAGREVLAHEMAHVVQQDGAEQGTGASGPRGDAFEAEADRAGQAVAAGGAAAPALRTPTTVAQGYGASEHQGMGDNVHAILDQVAAEAEDPEFGVCREGEDDPIAGESRIPTFGGFTEDERMRMRFGEIDGKPGSHTPGAANADAVESRAVAVPQLAQLLADDPFIDRARSLTLPLRNFKVMNDTAGAYLGIEIDEATNEAVRYDVPASPGDLTSMMGDLYGSMENVRKAPATEFVEIQRIVDAEADYERRIAAGTADPKNEPNFDDQWDAATAWRSKPVYAPGREVGKGGDLAGADTRGYMGLAKENQAHFGDDTQAKHDIEIKVETAGLPQIAAGPQGNYASGNEQAFMSGHAKALLLAKESFDLRPSAGPTAAAAAASADHYGHETNVPETGLLDPHSAQQDLAKPTDTNNHLLKRSSGVITAESKLNDAYVEGAGGDHFLTDAFSAGHNIVRDVIGRVADQFVQDKGGRDKFLSFVAEQLQYGAFWDKEKAAGDLGTFQEASHTWKDKAARGDSWLNSEWNVLRIVGIGGDGLKQKLDTKLDDVALHGIAAKLVHDYYNKRGMIVHNRKGMTFLTKGDGHVDEAPEAARIIALAVLESRNQITQMARTGVTPNLMDVWEYTPDFDKTIFTETSGRQVLEVMFADGDYLWHLMKGHISADTGPEIQPPAGAVDKDINRTADPGETAASPDGSGRVPSDMGTAPMRQWLRKRREWLRVHGQPRKGDNDPDYFNESDHPRVWTGHMQ